MTCLPTLRPESGPVLLDSGRIFRMENHDQALEIWRSSGLRGCTLLHVDAHHDAWNCERESDLTIANFLSPALREGIVDEVLWAVPDGSWDSRPARRHVLTHMVRIAGTYGAAAPLVEERAIRVTVLGKPISALPLKFLPRLTGNLLLDLDTDFLIIERVTYGASDANLALPWCWPEELLHRLAATGAQPALATIAFSVIGSYTPLQWKYLGDELAVRMSGGDVRVFEMLRAGAIAEAAGDVSAAEAAYRRAAETDPRSAAPWYRLALLLRATRTAEAQEAYRRAASLDQSYRTPFRSRGFLLHADKRYAEAEQAHRAALQLDPADAYARLGLGQALAAAKRWAEAESELRAAAVLNPALPDAQISLAEVLQHNGNCEQAAAACEQFLRLTLQGARTLQAPICTVEPSGRLDPQHFRVHARRAAALEKMGRLDAAEQAYRMSLAAKKSDLGARWGLARTNWRLHRRSAAAAECARLAPIALAKFGRRIKRLLLRALSNFKIALLSLRGASGGRS